MMIQIVNSVNIIIRIQSISSNRWVKRLRTNLLFSMVILLSPLCSAKQAGSAHHLGTLVGNHQQGQIDHGTEEGYSGRKSEISGALEGYAVNVHIQDFRNVFRRCV